MKDLSEQKPSRLLLQRRQKRLRKILSLTDPVALLRALWVMDRARRDSDFVLPRDFEVPDEWVRNRVDPSSALQDWELETLFVELLQIRRSPRPLEANPNKWGFFRETVNLLRDIENQEAALQKGRNIFW